MVGSPLVPTVRHRLDDALADQVTVKSGHHLPPGARPYRAVPADRGIDGVEAPWDGPGRRWLEKLELPTVEREIVDVCALLPARAGGARNMSSDRLEVCHWSVTRR